MPLVSAEVPEASTPVLSNQFHLGHNLGQFFIHNWAGGRAFISLGLSSVLITLAACRRHAEYRVAAWWSMSVIGTIFCFGYVNETRLYLGLLVFWFAYAWPDVARR
jgi:hypothetical protein